MWPPVDLDVHHLSFKKTARIFPVNRIFTAAYFGQVLLSFKYWWSLLLTVPREPMTIGTSTTSLQQEYPTGLLNKIPTLQAENELTVPQRLHLSFSFDSMVKWESDISYSAAPFLLVTTTMSVLFWSILWSVWIGKPHSNLHSSDSSTGFGSLWCIFTAGLSMLEISVPSCIRSQQAASDFKDSSEDPCWSQQDCSLKCCQFYPSIYVFQVALQSLRNSNRCFHNNEDKFTLFIFLSSLIWIARSRYLLIFSSFLVSTLQTLGYAMLFCSSTNTMSGWTLIVTQFLVSLYRKIPKYDSHYLQHSCEYCDTTCHSFLIHVVCTNLLHRVAVYILSVPTLAIRMTFFCRDIRHRESFCELSILALIALVLSDWLCAAIKSPSVSFSDALLEPTPRSYNLQLHLFVWNIAHEAPFHAPLPLCCLSSLD